MKLIRFCVPVVLLLSALGSCASAPPTLVALLPPPDAVTARTTVENAGPTVLLRRVTIPGYLDSFPVVIGRTGETLLLANNTEWAERLSDAAARVLRAAMSQRLGASRMLIEGDGRIPDADLSVEFLALDPRGDGRLWLDARWGFLGTAGARTSYAGRTSLQVPLDSPTASSVAAATTRALRELADVLAKEAGCLRADGSAQETSAGRRQPDRCGAR